ncbi:vacuolar protein sorting-associated protein 55 [Tanacetum coccineum]
MLPPLSLMKLLVFYGRWIDAAKFLTGASVVGSIAIPIILRHAHLISIGAMLIEFMSFFIFVGTVMCFHRANLEDEWACDGVMGIKRPRRDPSSDGIRDLATASGRGQLNEDLASST